MNTASASSFQSLAAPFLDPSDIKVWSVIVTIMGDLAPDGVIGGPILTALVETMGLQAQAMRVALHRLKKDGWVDNDRIGRIGYYRLTDMARQSTDDVRDRVYGSAPQRLERCTLSVLAPDQTGAGLEIAPRVILTTEAGPKGALNTALTTDALPDWAAPAIGQAACVEPYRALWADIEAVLATLQPSNLTDVEKAALRIVILHRWRRVVLRASPFAEALLEAGQAPEMCRLAIRQVFDALPRPSLEVLGSAVGMS